MLSRSLPRDTHYQCLKCGFRMHSTLTLKGRPYYDEHQCPECWRAFLTQHIGVLTVMKNDDSSATPPAQEPPHG